jgi:hypothetical protein
VERLKREITELRVLPFCKSATTNWGVQSVQVLFEESQATAAITKKIKDTWWIPRKFYWLKVNGVHESGIKTWP